MHFQAVIGFQSKLFEVYLEEERCYLTDLIYGPKIQILFDHPFWFYGQLQNHGSDFFVLTHDETYVEFIRYYAPAVSGCYLLPPGGNIQKMQTLNRDLDVVFLGTYNNYREIFTELKGFSRDIRHIVARYMRYLKKYVDWPAEKAFSQMLSDYGIAVGKEDFVRMMYEIGGAHQYMIYYYREK